MSTADALVDLIVRYEEMVQGGQAPTPEEICIDFPELLEEFQQRIEELQKNRGFFDSTEDGEYAHTTNASLGGGDCEALPQIPGFHVLEKLGQGGMGLVLLVHEPSLNRRLALKILPRRQGRNPESVRQFVDEAQIAGQLQHPGIPPIHQLGELNGQPYFTMKLIKGQTLAKLLKENDPRVRMNLGTPEFSSRCVRRLPMPTVTK